MTQRLANAVRRVRAADGKLLMTALVIADPYLDATLEYMRVLAEEGADMLELIFPFSDPTYHGAVIQRASGRAIREEVTWQEIIELGQEFRTTHDTPLFFSTYYNRVLARGIDAFAETLISADFDGAMVTDLPWSESGELRKALSSRGLTLPSAVAPTTPDERFRQIAAGSSGFLLWTGHSGGTPTISEDRFRERMSVFRDITDLPVLASMKIQTGQDAATVAADCDGVLVGSALVWLIEGRGPDITTSLADFVHELRSGVDQELPPEPADEGGSDE